MSADAEPPTQPVVGRPRREPPPWMRRVGLGSWYFLGFCAAVALLSFLIAVSRDVTVPLIVGVFLAVAFTPLVDRLTRRAIPRAIAAGLVVLLIMIMLVGAVVVVAVGLAGQGDDLQASIDAAVDEVKRWLAEVEIDEKIADQVRGSVNDGTDAATQGLAHQAIGIVNSAVGLVTGSVLGLIILYYLLKDGAHISDAFIERQPRSRRDLFRKISDQSTASVQAYAKGQTLIAAVNGAVMGVAALIFGIPLPFSIGMVNFVGAYIPYFGAFIGGAFAALLALSVGGIGLAITIIVVAVLMNLVLENALQPLLVGGQMDLHPLVVLLATVAGGLVAGLVGLILAAPLTAIALAAFRDLEAEGFFD